MAAPRSYSGFVFGLVIRLLLCGLLAFVLEHYLHYDGRSARLVSYVAALVWLYFYFKRQEANRTRGRFHVLIKAISNSKILKPPMLSF